MFKKNKIIFGLLIGWGFNQFAFESQFHKPRSILVGDFDDKSIEIPDSNKSSIVNLNDTETFTVQTYKELITERFPASYMIARVISVDNADVANPKFYEHYFDAASLNKYLFYDYESEPTVYLNDDYLRKYLLSKKNTINRMPIQNVQYFIIDNILEPNFKFYKNISDLKVKKQIDELEDIINNPIEHPNYRSFAQYLLGKRYFTVNRQKAREMLQAVIDNPQYADPRDLYSAQYFLSGICYMEKDYQKAREMLQVLTDNPQYAYFEQLSSARFNLGNIYYHGEGGEVNYQKAREMFQAVIDNPKYASLTELFSAQAKINSIDMRLIEDFLRDYVL